MHLVQDKALLWKDFHQNKSKVKVNIQVCMVVYLQIEVLMLDINCSFMK